MKLLLLLISLNCFGQDTLIKNLAYTSTYSKTLKAPLMVSYHLYKGGGDCSRAGDSFHGGYFTAHNSDYDFNYDKGHLANAEDFAYDCNLQEITFRYWNCYPQTPELNRGIWKKLETQVRKLSQSDSLIVYCGGFYGSVKIGNGVSVPDSCWKIIYNLTTKVYSKGFIFTNTKEPVKYEIDAIQLQSLLIKRYGIRLYYKAN